MTAFSNRSEEIQFDEKMTIIALPCQMFVPSADAEFLTERPIHVVEIGNHRSDAGLRNVGIEQEESVS